MEEEEDGEGSWRERYFTLEASLLKFRRQATQIKESLKVEVGFSPGLLFTKRQILGLAQAFGDIKINMMEELKLRFGKIKKDCGKRRKCW